MIAKDFSAAFAACPLVAILRGLTPQEAPEIGDALSEAGFTLIEVPLNSPQPLESIRILRERLGSRAMIGAGTVLSPAAVDDVAAAGGQFIVSPNTDPVTIKAAAARGLASFPGYYTASEAFAALSAGATALKLFPADGADPSMLKAQRAVLPPETIVLAVGGVNVSNIAQWRGAGANGFGLGSNLYKPGKAAAAVLEDARALFDAVKSLA